MSVEKCPETNSVNTEAPPSRPPCGQHLQPSGPNTPQVTPPAKVTRFPGSERSRDFRKRYFPDASLRDWNNWHWQIQNALRTPEELGKIINLTDDERTAMGHGGAMALPTSVTPYYASLINPDNPDDPIRRSMIPTTRELLHSPGEADDPLGEDKQSPTPGLVHRYPDRALFLATEHCSSYCRYCTRSRMVGRQERVRYSCCQWEKALEYIKNTPAIRDVILSGGDPLTLPDEALEWLLINLRAIKHVEVIRIGTKTPAVLPMRITPALTRIIQRSHPIWMSLHFTHPDELTVETAEACGRLADAGAPLGSQTVLLRGINDNPEVLRDLMTGLMKMRVRPYYLYQCDPITGSAHFRTTAKKGLEMIAALRGHVSGYAVPQYVIDLPGGGGKAPLLPNSTLTRNQGVLEINNYRGDHYCYPDMDA